MCALWEEVDARFAVPAAQSRVFLLVKAVCVCVFGCVRACVARVELKQEIAVASSLALALSCWDDGVDDGQRTTAKRGESHLSILKNASSCRGHS